MMLDIFTGQGIFQLAWWAYILLALALTHITITSVTLYLHRCQTHRSVDFHPAVSHFMRFWLWLTTGMVTQHWVAIHRKHHAKVETEEDPHSPVFRGINEVLYRGSELYRSESFNQDTLDQYSHNRLPTDAIEKRLYSYKPQFGLLAGLVIQFILFGFFGVAVWAVQMMWIPFFAAGVINGIGHHKGYRNFECDDCSTNISNIGIIIGGEELHNNHHAYPSSAKFSIKWWEFDIGWLYIKILSALGLAKVLRLAPMPKKQHKVLSLSDALTQTTLASLIRGRPHVLREYITKVVKPVLKCEYKEASQRRSQWFRSVKNALVKHRRHTTEKDILALKEAVLKSTQLKTVCEFKDQLEDLLHNYRDQNKLLESLQEWCQKAEQSGVDVLAKFSQRIRTFSV